VTTPEEPLAGCVVVGEVVLVTVNAEARVVDYSYWQRKVLGSHSRAGS
jgi:hypothetical protein